MKKEEQDFKKTLFQLAEKVTPVQVSAWCEGYVEGLETAYAICMEHKSRVCNSVREELKNAIIMLGGDIHEEE